MAHPHHAPQNAAIVGSGPNGLAAAIVMAHAGFATQVFEAQPTPGGACRTLPLTLPGFLHDFGSAVHPLAAGSPFFQQLPLQDHGLTWLHHDAPLAHPLDDGTAVILVRDLDAAAHSLGTDGAAWKALMQPLTGHWDALTNDILQPLIHIPHHPALLARFGVLAALPARLLASTALRTERARALFAGLAAHSFLSLDAPFSSATALVLGAAAHAVGWPIPQGGAGSITAALLSVLQAQGGQLHLNHPITSVDDFEKLDNPGGLDNLDQLDQDSILLCDISPAQLATLAAHRLPSRFLRQLRRFQPGPGAFKIDYALSQPIPWTARDCLRAGTVHLGGTLAEITRSERTMLRGTLPDQPYVLIAQPTLADPSRAPDGKHVAWAYCHVPNGFTGDATPQIEAQLERFAPGFRDCILARSTSGPARLQQMDANLVGGDISGGAMHLSQLLLRPTRRTYRTPDPHLFLCSSSTPPGAGVHGMCGFHAATAALHRW